MDGDTRGGAVRVITNVVMATVMVAGGLTVVATPAHAAPVAIKVTIEQVGECCGGRIDTVDGADFYGRIFIQGQETRFGVFAEDENVIRPNWVAKGAFENYAEVIIEIFDKDGFANFDDNQIDVSTGPAGNPRSVDLGVISTPGTERDCQIILDVSGSCNEVIRSFGTDDEDSDVGDVFFKIEVDPAEPPQAPGLHVGCLHSPIWPQPGQSVTLTASSFGDQPDGQALPAKLVDTLQIWYSTDGGITRQVTTSTGKQNTFTTTKTAGADASTFSYGCRAVDAGVPIYSGWRTVQVGNPPQGQGVPVLLSTDREHGLDFVLFPVTQNVRRNPNSPTDTALYTYPTYTGPTDPNFLTQVGVSVAELFREQTVLDNQRQLNIWIARDGAATGGARDLNNDSDGDGSDDDPAMDTTGDGIPDGDGRVDACQHVGPANLATAYGFANVRSYVHPATPPPGNTDTVRECATGGVFSSEANETGVFIHETGHTGWGLADEYCCDGGYNPPALLPNVYRNLKACQDDVESLGGVDEDCVGFDSNDADMTLDVWRSDPGTSQGAGRQDLMVNNTFARRADRRRMNWVFGQCFQAISC